MRVDQQKAYILVNRPYSETSWVVEVFSREFGRLALMAKGARRIKSKFRGALIPFQPTLLSWTGKGEVPTLTLAEVDQSDFDLTCHELTGDALVCGFYCNELVAILLHRHDPHPRLYDCYHAAIIRMAESDSTRSLANALREFERAVIKEIGYEVDFKREADGKTPIVEGAYYRFQPGQGFVRAAEAQRNSFPGGLIRALGADKLVHASNADLALSKQLMRDILRHTLGRREIVSRDLFYPKHAAANPVADQHRPQL